MPFIAVACICHLYLTCVCICSLWYLIWFKYGMYTLKHFNMAISRRRHKLFGHIMRHPETPEHQVIFNGAMSWRRIHSSFRRGHPRMHWNELALAEAHSQINILATGYTPGPPNLDHPFYHTPDTKDIYASLGGSLRRFYDTTHLIRNFRPTAQERDAWKKLQQ